MFWLKSQSLGSVLVEPVIRESITVRTMVEMSCLLYGCREGERGKKERDRIEKDTGIKTQRKGEREGRDD